MNMVSKSENFAGNASDKPTILRGAQLGRLMRAAKPALVAACAGIDAEKEFAGSPTKHLEARILRKIDAYRAWIVQHGLRPPVSNHGVASISILEHIGHAGAKLTDAIRVALVGLEDLLPDDGEAFSKPDGEPVDVLIGFYAIAMKERGFGLPLNGPSGRYCWRRACEEIGCKPKDLNERRKAFLRSIDRAIGVPGEAVVAPTTHWDPTLRNAAVPALLALELKRLKGKMPADPLHPTMIDAVQVAEGAGVTVRDIVGGSLAAENLQAMEDARNGKALVPHPMVAGRRFTIKDLKEFGRKAREAEAKALEHADPANTARITVRALTQFLGLPKLGGKTSDLVPLDLPDRIRRAIASRPKGFGSGWASQIQRWIGYYDAVRSEKPLPNTFATAIRILAAEVGISAYQIIRTVGARAHNWLHGLAFPTVESASHILALEKLLRVLPGTLTRLLTKEWQSRRFELKLSDHGLKGVSKNLPDDFATKSPDEQLAIARAKWSHHVRQETEFANRLSSQIRDRYRLPFAKWPKVMQDAWIEHTPELNEVRPYREADLRLPGKRPSKAERSNAKREEDRSWRPLTERMAERMLGYYFGFLVRERAKPKDEGDVPGGPNADATGPTAQEEADFIAEPGLGMPIELIHPALFLVIDLLTAFAHWRKRRSGGRFAPTIAQTLQHAADFLKPETGLVWKTEYQEYLVRFQEWWDKEGALAQGDVFLDLDAFVENWQVAVGETHAYLLEDIEEMRPGDPKRKKLRLPFKPLKGYLAEHDPMVPYMADVRKMLASRPLGMVDRHRHTRNCILTLVVLQTGLRAATLMFTVAGDEPTLRREEAKDKSVRWRIVIPSSRFKNFSSPFFANAQDYDFTLDDEDGLYALLDDYMARGRPYLLNGRTSDALFIGNKGKALSAAGLSNVYRSLTGRFLAHDADAETGTENVLPHGLHAVRHIIATSLLRTTGDIYIAAWAIQDTARTVEQHYVDFLPRNKAMLAVVHLRKSRAAPEPLPLAE
ncbi:hypothetical protein ACM61V_04360 [Sphingomonas sp. TX0543]|uniref:hypothetical protein n=1 Tax=unclassified Sphingomonas TaxID=196159 RepID=UPI0010F8BC1B|nr:hypothetical protein [Sphingomonas sp. 3P27F8]